MSERSLLMKTTGWWALLLIMMTTVTWLLAGCGNGGGRLATNGTLSLADITLTDLSGGKYAVETTVTFTSASETNIPGGPEIEYKATFGNITRTGKVIPQGTTGTAVIGPWEVDQAFEPVIIKIEASTGGLSATKISSLPAIASLSVAPAAVSFTNTDTAGTSKTAVVSGGFSPYTVASAVPGDISATISGSSVTITRLTASGATNTSTTVTVTDNRGNQTSIVVGYFK